MISQVHKVNPSIFFQVVKEHKASTNHCEDPINP